MRHLCKNFIVNGKCTKCRTPEWALYFPEFKHKLGSKVRLPQDYTDGGEEFFVVKFDKNGYTLSRTKEAVDIVQYYDWWELYPIDKEKPT